MIIVIILFIILIYNYGKKIFYLLDFYFIFQRNGTSRREAKLTAKTGIKDRKETGQLYKFKGESKLDWWSGDYCNQIT